MVLTENDLIKYDDTRIKYDNVVFLPIVKRRIKYRLCAAAVKFQFQFAHIH